MAHPAPARLLWRCRRGMKELDLLLEGFAREQYEGASPERRRAFERLLELPDPWLVELLLGGPAAAAADAPDAPAGPGGAALAIAGDAELERVAALVAAPGRR